MHLSTIFPLISLLPAALSTLLDTRKACSTENTITDGGFDSGLTTSYSTATWKISELQGSTSYSLTKPGSTLPGGKKYAFTAGLAPDPYDDDSRVTLSQTLKTCPGQNYSITYDYNFGSTAPENPCLITLIYPAGTKQASTITGNQDEGVVAGQWAQTGALFQGVSDSGLLSLVLKCGARGKSAIGVDNVVVKPYDGDVF